MTTKLQELKAISARKKELAAQQKQLKEELDATKGERVKYGKIIADCRRTVRSTKSTLRDLHASTHSAISDKDPKELENLTNAISSTSAELIHALRTIQSAQEKLEQL